MELLNTSDRRFKNEYKKELDDKESPKACILLLASFYRETNRLLHFDIILGSKEIFQVGTCT
jgi:hypothetical protein